MSPGAGQRGDSAAGWRHRPSGCCACAWAGAACAWPWGTCRRLAGLGCGDELPWQELRAAEPEPWQVTTAWGSGGQSGCSRGTRSRSTCCGSTTSTAVGRRQQHGPRTRRGCPLRTSAGATRCAAFARWLQVRPQRPAGEPRCGGEGARCEKRDEGSNAACSDTCVLGHGAYIVSCVLITGLSAQLGMQRLSWMISEYCMREVD